MAPNLRLVLLTLFINFSVKIIYLNLLRISACTNILIETQVIFMMIMKIWTRTLLNWIYTSFFLSCDSEELDFYLLYSCFCLDMFLMTGFLVQYIVVLMNTIWNSSVWNCWCIWNQLILTHIPKQTLSFWLWAEINL